MGSTVRQVQQRSLIGHKESFSRKEPGVPVPRIALIKHNQNALSLLYRSCHIFADLGHASHVFYH